MYLPLWDSSWERRLHWSTRPPLEKIPRDSSPPWGKDLPRSSSPHLLHRIWDELYHVSCFPLIVHVPCGSCVFVGLVDVWLDLFLSVPLVFSLVFILFLGIPPPIRERSSLRVPPYNTSPIYRGLGPLPKYWAGRDSTTASLKGDN